MNKLAELLNKKYVNHIPNCAINYQPFLTHRSMRFLPSWTNGPNISR